MISTTARLVLVTPPINEPLTAAEAKARLNIGSDVSDLVIDAYLLAARQRIDGADGYLGRALITQTWTMSLDCFPADRIYFPLLPVQAVSEISYPGADGLPVVVDPASYRMVQAQRPYIVPVSAWPTVADADVTITFVAGYGDDGDDVPEPIRTAIALAAGHINHLSVRNPAIVQEIEEGIGSTRYGVTADVFKVIDDTVQNLLSTYRVIVL
jgi:uncharacterized phiE125 gp8 family phage protein